MNYAHEFEPKKRKRAIDRILDYAQGTEDRVSVYDQFADLKFEDLKTQLERRLLTATLEERTRLNFDLALFRDLRYAVAGSRHCLKLGVVNNIRELYEGQRLLEPNDQIND